MVLPNLVKNKTMSEENVEWIFDSIVGFLKGPVWNYPVLTFIEHKSLVFEPEENDENEEIYKQTFNEYKNMIEYMLKSYMTDMNITPNQFEDACKIATKRFGSKYRKVLFEQIWAANDYQIFKQMMIHKNVQLQLEALKILQKKYGVTLNPAINKSKEEIEKLETVEDSDDETKLLNKVRDLSLKEHEEYLQQLDEENKIIEKTIAESVVLQHEIVLQTQEQDRSKKLAAEMIKCVDDTLVFKKEVSFENENTDEVTQIDKEKHAEEIKLEKEIVEEKNETVLPIQSEQSRNLFKEEDLIKRREFLKSQRDKLLAMKKKERAKQLEELSEKEFDKIRPKSSKAARSLVSEPNSAIDNETLKLRRALAQKLKHEVIEHSDF